MSKNDLGAKAGPTVQDQPEIAPDMPTASMYFEMARAAHDKGDVTTFRAARTMLVVSMGLSSNTR